MPTITNLTAGVFDFPGLRLHGNETAAISLAQYTEDEGFRQRLNHLYDNEKISVSGIDGFPIRTAEEDEKTASGGVENGGAIPAVGGDGGSVSAPTALHFAGAVTDSSGAAAVGTFTWAQDINPTDPAGGNNSPADGQTWLDTSRAESDGYYTLNVWADVAGGWTNYLPSGITGAVAPGSGTTFEILNNGGIKVIGGDTALPTSDPGVSGQLWNADDQVVLSGFAGGSQTLADTLALGADANAVTITNLGAPASSADAATKGYVDAHGIGAIGASTRVVADPTVTIPGDGNPVYVPFTLASRDDIGMWDDGDPTKLTVPDDGMYLFVALAQWRTRGSSGLGYTSGLDYRFVGLFINTGDDGSVISRPQNQDAGEVDGQAVLLSYLTAGKYVRLVLKQGSGGPVVVDVPEVSVVRLSA